MIEMFGMPPSKRSGRLCRQDEVHQKDECGSAAMWKTTTQIQQRSDEEMEETTGQGDKDECVGAQVFEWNDD